MFAAMQHFGEHPAKQGDIVNHLDQSSVSARPP
jgi:hypothetical protein